MSKITEKEIIKELGISEEAAKIFAVMCKNNNYASDIFTFKDSISGETYSIKITEEQAKQMNAELEDTEEYEKWIRNQDFGANGDTIKEILIKILSVTQSVGDTILRIGKILVDWFIKFIQKVLKEFPNTIFGVLAGLILGLLISNIPLIGWIVGGFIVTLCASVGGIMGFVADMKKKINDPALVENVENGIKSFLFSTGKIASNLGKIATNGVKAAIQKA